MSFSGLKAVKSTMTDPSEEVPPIQQHPLTSREDTDASRQHLSGYGATGGISNVLSPVDEERPSRPKPTQTQNNASAQMSSTSTSSNAQSGNAHAYQSPAMAIMGPLTPPRSPLAGQVMYQQQQQLVTSGGLVVTPPRTQSSTLSSKGSAKRSKSKSQRSGSKRRSSKKSNKQQAPDTTLFTEMSTGGVASSIKKSLSNISLFTATDGDADDEEAATITSLSFGNAKSYHDDDLTSAHHRAELYGQIGGPTGMLGAFGDKRGCKRFLVLITLAFILLSLVLDVTTDGGNSDGNSEGTREGTDETAVSSSSQEIDSFLKGEIGELTPGKCRQIIDKQTSDLEEAVGKNDDLEKEITILENVIHELKERLQVEEKGSEEHGR